jgi:hypothetical protein
MKHYIDPKLFNNFLNDFKPLFKLLKTTNGEFDLRLREESFNIYYQGNSVARIDISPPSKKPYRVSIHDAFIIDVYDKEKRFKPFFKTLKTGYQSIDLEAKDIHPFFQRKYLDHIASNIKKRNYGEEITLEQRIITDNWFNCNTIIIDRQISAGVRFDLLALKHLEANKYSFLIIEVKLGNNSDLKGKVATQLSGYVSHVKVPTNFREWKNNYEEVYKQLKAIGIHPNLIADHIEIIEPVEGKIVVGGYSGISVNYIQKLKSLIPGVEIQEFRNYIS